MGYQLATLIWILLIISVVLSAMATVALIGVGVEDSDPKMLGLGVLVLFLTAIIGWGIWVIYPLTAAAMA